VRGQRRFEINQTRPRQYGETVAKEHSRDFRRRRQRRVMIAVAVTTLIAAMLLAIVFFALVRDVVS